MLIHCARECEFDTCWCSTMVFNVNSLCQGRECEFEYLLVLVVPQWYLMLILVVPQWYLMLIHCARECEFDSCWWFHNGI